MYCNICQQPKHGHLELCPEWKDEGQAGHMPDGEEYVTLEPEIDEWFWED